MKNSPDAYTRLLLDVLRGKQATFVRDDELQAAWDIFTPLLHKMYPDQITPVRAAGAGGANGASSGRHSNNSKVGRVRGRSPDVPPVLPYTFGSRGPKESDAIVRRMGYQRSDSYEWPARL